MNKHSLATIIQEGSRLLSEVMRTYPRHRSQQPSRAPVASKEEGLTTDETIALPTTEETVAELRRRLGKELYRLEMDLQGGARFAGKPCDCLEHKHKLGLEATTEELMSYETDPVYGKIINWLNLHEYPPKEVLKHPPEYFQKLAPELRRFRKRVMGTESPQALLKKEVKNVNEASSVSTFQDREA